MADVDHGPRIGADPELFVRGAEGNIVPICGKIGGTKDRPLVINDLINKNYGDELASRRGSAAGFRIGDYAIQEDNVMLEFNVPAYKDGSYFIESITKMMVTLENTVLPQQNLSIAYEATTTFKPEDLAPFPQAFTVGCMPDKNAYAEKGRFVREPFNATHFGNNRFCGGHLHIQYNKTHVPGNIFAQFMDLAVEIPFLAYDKQGMRRMFYGQPGIYRDKPYGIEYRTPSNFWLDKNFRAKGGLMILVENVMALARFANNDVDMLKKAYSQVSWTDVQKAIQREDTRLAGDLLEHVRYKVGLSFGTV